MISGRIQLSGNEKVGFDGSRIEVGLAGKKGSVKFDGVEVVWETKTAARGIVRAPKRGLHCEYFDADKVGAGVVLRHWQPGDRIQLIGMKSAVKLQNLFTNLKVSRVERHRAIVGGAGGRGGVLGGRAAAGRSVSSSTSRPGACCNGRGNGYNGRSGLKATAMLDWLEHKDQNVRRQSKPRRGPAAQERGFQDAFQELDRVDCHHMQRGAGRAAA